MNMMTADLATDHATDLAPLLRALGDEARGRVASVCWGSVYLLFGLDLVWGANHTNPNYLVLPAAFQTDVLKTNTMTRPAPKKCKPVRTHSASIHHCLSPIFSVACARISLSLVAGSRETAGRRSKRTRRGQYRQRDSVAIEMMSRHRRQSIDPHSTTDLVTTLPCLNVDDLPHGCVGTVS